MAATHSAGVVVYIAKQMFEGAPSMVRAALATFLLAHPEHRTGEYVAMGGELLHLWGWTTCGTTAEKMINYMDSCDPDRVTLLTGWPVDVSSWPPVQMSDAPGLLHIPPRHAGGNAC